MHAVIDAPQLNISVDPLCFLVRGWVWYGTRQPDIAAIEAWVENSRVGETAAIFERSDVTAALGLQPPSASGFELFAHHAAGKPGTSFELRLHARWRDDSLSPPLATRRLDSISRDYRCCDFGVLLDQNNTVLQRRPNIYNEGPSVFGGSDEVSGLIRRYVGQPPERIIDVGCGLGYYGRGLLADGYDWIGAEVDADDCAELTRQGLPHRHVDGRTLPFANDSFDTALCIEVLEHIDEPRAFLAEIKRVAPRRLIVSVPNCELLAYLRDHLAVPWHMLEPDHKNFFTRWSLRALLRDFYSQVEMRFHTPHPLRSPEGCTLHYNLFAVASSPS